MKHYSRRKRNTIRRTNKNKKQETRKNRITKGGDVTPLLALGRGIAGLASVALLAKKIHDKNPTLINRVGKRVGKELLQSYQQSYQQSKFNTPQRRFNSNFQYQPKSQIGNQSYNLRSNRQRQLNQQISSEPRLNSNYNNYSNYG